MEIVKFKREQEQHMAHINRIRNVKPVLNTSTPESLGLKHLNYRPKKMQLIEDRRQLIAKENAKLMGLMTDVMNEKRQQPDYVRPSSLNEVERKREVDRLNFENKLMAHRLKTAKGVIDNSTLEKDFKRHLHAESNLRRKQMKPLSLPKDLHPKSTLLKKEGSMDGSGIGSGLFDASLYTTQRGHYLQGSSLEQLSTMDSTIGSGSPIKNVTDFRKQVIATKKMNMLAQNAEMRGSMQSSQSSPEYSNNHNNHNHNRPVDIRSDSLFEVSHNPGGR